jgi:hypothetical protein
MKKVKGRDAFPRYLMGLLEAYPVDERQLLLDTFESLTFEQMQVAIDATLDGSDFHDAIIAAANLA